MKLNVTAACLLLLAGCAGEETAGERESTALSEAPEADRIVACDLLPGSAVEDIMGGPVQRTNPDEYEDSSDSTRYMTSCTYISETPESMRTATIQVARAPEVTDPDAALREYEAGLAEVSPGLLLTPVPELEPGAGWHDEFEQLTLYRPGWRIMATVDRNGGMPGLEGARLLASRILERMPER